MHSCNGYPSVDVHAAVPTAQEKTTIAAAGGRLKIEAVTIEERGEEEEEEEEGPKDCVARGARSMLCARERSGPGCVFACVR
jgi:hypothetical protein